MNNLNITEQCIIILISQILFLWFRTLNIQAVSEQKVFKAIWTGNMIGLTWLIGIAIGANSMMQGNIWPILMHLLGGSIGTYIGMRKPITRKFKRR